jgi:hypothetical protein
MTFWVVFDRLAARQLATCNLQLATGQISVSGSYIRNQGAYAWMLLAQMKSG